MMDLAWLLILAAYAIGTFPSALLVGRLVGRDPTKFGSLNPGATNTYRISGKKAGGAVLIADVAKGLAATLLGQAVGGHDMAVLCGAAAVLGHIFPAQRRFRGGKGVATFGGAAFGAWPWVGLIGLGVWLAATRVTRKASVGALLAAPAVTVGVALTGRPLWEIAVAAGLALIVIVRHRTNIQRLLNREEASPAPSAPAAR